MDVNYDSDLYMHGSTIYAYLSILCHERIGTEVTMYTCENIVVSHSDNNQSEMLKTGLREFLCRKKVPENDVVLFPVCKNSHYYVIFVLTKLYFFFSFTRHLGASQLLPKFSKLLDPLHPQY
jgi:hypothetical protein